MFKQCLLFISGTLVHKHMRQCFWTFVWWWSKQEHHSIYLNFRKIKPNWTHLLPLISVEIDECIITDFNYDYLRNLLFHCILSQWFETWVCLTLKDINLENQANKRGVCVWLQTHMPIRIGNINLFFLVKLKL